MTTIDDVNNALDTAQDFLPTGSYDLFKAIVEVLAQHEAALNIEINPQAKTKKKS